MTQRMKSDSRQRYLMRMMNNKLREAVAESPASVSRISFPSVILDCHSRPHDVVVERRLAVLGHEHRLNEETDLADIAPELLGEFELAAAIGGHDDSHVDVTVRVGVALAVGTEHHDLRLHVEAGAYHLLVSADELESLVAGKCSSIHCCICLVSSIICRQACGVSVRVSSSLSSG